ncbi:16S rRNA (guanine(527)-N(7))-methyltransferase RsmG [Pseudoruegeria sp. HB172150]|uniref:16S rRNA (guanine(527)-N(7))-methyltransferase RsmG n=1 Tax=Pseudoruegeria sp. HB172150 TaxID=2721164 RepID=UPI0015521C48|nr:16S rRNA (guanine(527)-N(7))-methyltransferase RsmG [Pseudoruegeria sp. HB172150]
MSAGAEAFAAQVNVSRETLERLETYDSLIRKWNKAINLVANSTLDDLWNRHFLDSAAAFSAVPTPSGRWVDLGSGGGFPGAVVAIMAAEVAPDLSVTCIEADIRKASFLRTLSVETGVPINVLSRRIEQAPPQNAQYLSARALAPLTQLLAHAEQHLDPTGTAIFLKGESWRQEVETALETYRFSVENIPSPTQHGAAILVIGGISRA